MEHGNYPDSYIRGILNTVKTIAMVGFSPKDNRPSYFAFKYLKERGYNMIPINPGHAGKEVLGRMVYARLADVPGLAICGADRRGSAGAATPAASDLDAARRPQPRGRRQG